MQGGKAWQWNEWELLSLEAAGNYEKDNQRGDSFIEKMNVETHLLDIDKTIYGIGEE